MTLRFKINKYLIIPYGFNTKWDISKINIVGVDNASTYFESEVPCFYLNTNDSNPLRLGDINDITVDKVADEFHLQYFHDDALESIKEYLIT